MKIKLVDFGGEFCTSRKSPAIEKLREVIEKSIQSNTPIEILRDGVKVLTPSFIDELLPPLVIQYGEEQVMGIISFLPPLDGYLKEQLHRGVAARRKSQ
ncbi:MAG: hypothetical protein ACK5WZ_10995 [Pseudobdellovibrionaceae bacterium]|jgi:hypothetical protein